MNDINKKGIDSVRYNLQWFNELNQMLDQLLNCQKLANLIQWFELNEGLAMVLECSKREHGLNISD